jgi:hypothetical protein
VIEHAESMSPLKKRRLFLVRNLNPNLFNARYCVWNESGIDLSRYYLKIHTLIPPWISLLMVGTTETGPSL